MARRVAELVKERAVVAVGGVKRRPGRHADVVFGRRVVGSGSAMTDLRPSRHSRDDLLGQLDGLEGNGLGLLGGGDVQPVALFDIESVVETREGQLALDVFAIALRRVLDPVPVEDRRPLLALADGSAPIATLLEG